MVNMESISFRLTHGSLTCLYLPYLYLGIVKLFLIHLTLVLYSRAQGVRERYRQESHPCLTHGSDTLKMKCTLTSVCTIMLSCSLRTYDLEEENYKLSFCKKKKGQT